MINYIIKNACRDLRLNSTKSEIILWNYIKGKQLGYRFLRQYPLYVYTEDSGLDRYVIPDFYCHKKKIILEVDGSIHNKEEVYRLDLYKEKLLKNIGFKVIRIRNEDIKQNINNVIKTIKLYL